MHWQLLHFQFWDAATNFFFVSLTLRFPVEERPELAILELGVSVASDLGKGALLNKRAASRAAPLTMAGFFVEATYMPSPATIIPAI